MRKLALGMLAVALSAPVAANAAETAASPAPQLVAQLGAKNARFTLLDQNGNPVGILIANGPKGLTLRQIARSTATGAPAASRTFKVDFSKSLTTQQIDEAYRTAYDDFNGITHTP